MPEGLTEQVDTSPANEPGPGVESRAESGAEPGPDVVRAEGLTFGYPGRRVLREVDLSIRAG